MKQSNAASPMSMKRTVTARASSQLHAVERSFKGAVKLGLQVPSRHQKSFWIGTNSLARIMQPPVNSLAHSPRFICRLYSSDMRGSFNARQPLSKRTDLRKIQCSSAKKEAREPESKVWSGPQLQWLGLPSCFCVFNDSPVQERSSFAMSEGTDTTGAQKCKRYRTYCVPLARSFCARFVKDVVA